MKVTVSIIMITYNHEAYIANAIEGVLMQKTNFNYELLVADDFSKDNSQNIICKFAEENHSIINPILRTKNLGANLNWCFAFSKCKGKYIAICEGDDYWIDPLKLQKQVDFMETHPDYSMCFHNAIVIFEERNSPPIYFNKYQIDRDFNTEDIINEWTIPTASMVFRKDMVIPLPTWFNTIYSGDLTLALLLSHSGKIRYLNNLMSIYRKNSTGISVILKDRIRFILDQKVILFTLFDKETNGKYKKTIENAISKMKIDVKYSIYKKKFLFLPILLMPSYMIKKIYRKFIKKSKS